MGRIAGRFARVEPRHRAARLVLGLLADLPRKNCWTIAEWAGETTPDGMQHLLGRAKWDADQVRDDVCGYVVEHLQDDRAVLVVDETGDVKKGTGTVGVQHQYTGTAGRIENSQVAVYLVYAGQRGHAAVDREIYVPRSWTSDPDRCRAAGLAEETTFATKPELVARFLDAGHQAAWVAGDEVYGGNPKLRTALEERGTGYVLAVTCSHEVTTGARKLGLLHDRVTSELACPVGRVGRMSLCPSLGRERGRGGGSAMASAEAKPCGPSPQARGRCRLGQCLHGHARTIPAGAGAGATGDLRPRQIMSRGSTPRARGDWRPAPAPTVTFGPSPRARGDSRRIRYRGPCGRGDNRTMPPAVNPAVGPSP